MSDIKYRRVLLKLTGESMAGESKRGLDYNAINSIAGQIKEVHELGIEIAIVIGGGNILRGSGSRSNSVRKNARSSG